MGLSRRAFLGAHLVADAEAFSEEGAKVAAVLPGSMAEAAGIAAGDVIAKVAGWPVRSLAELAGALRRAGSAAETEIVSVRGGELRAETVAVVPYPLETIPGHRVSYETLAVPGPRLRSIVTSPEGGARAPAVLVLQGIACESIDHGGDPDAPIAQLVRGFAEAGFATMRVDRRGIGDSEGGPCGETDFETDLADHRAALAALSADARVDPDRLVLFGHSVGGMVAPLLAAEHDVAAVAAYGTSPVKWLDCVAESARRQLELRGVDPAAIDRRVRKLRARLRDDPPPGRSVAYHRQLDAIDLEAAWRTVAAEVLVLRGEHDWVVGPEEQARIASLAPNGADVRDMSGLDHLMTRHGSLDESVRAYGQGEPAGTAIAREAVAWLRSRGVGSRS